MSIEAMKLALEALEECALMIEWEWGDCRFEEVMRETGEYTRETTPAITALRQAIEQAEKQEPVATVQCINGLIIGYLDVMQPVGTKLYTSPPPRQPLTDEEIDYMWRVATMKPGLTLPMVRSFARAIEAAHGITKENT